MTKVYITGIRLSGGHLVEHITHVWRDPHPTGPGIQVTTSTMADSIDKGEVEAWVKDPNTRQEAPVLVVRPTGRPKYLRTKADRDPNDNLLSLPRK